MTNLEYKQQMRKVMYHIINGAPFSELTTEERLILKECYDADYIQGLVILQMGTGRITAEIRHDPRISGAGHAFLNELHVCEIKEAEAQKKANLENSAKYKLMLLMKKFGKIIATGCIAIPVVFEIIDHMDVFKSFYEFITTLIFGE